MAEIGDPVDPVSNQPYDYCRTSASTYNLAAVGFPGIAKIDASTKALPFKP